MKMLREMQLFFSRWQLASQLQSDQNGITNTKLSVLNALIMERQRVARIRAFRQWRDQVIYNNYSASDKYNFAACNTYS